MRRPAWVVMTYAVLLLLAVVTALPNFLSKDIRDTLPPWATSQTVSLGLDLQGGAHLLLAVDRADLATARLQDLRQILVSEMRTLNLNPATIRADVTSLSAPANEALLTALKAAASATTQPGIPPDFTVDLSGDIIRLSLTASGLDRAASDAADASLEVIRHRVDQVGVSEPVISRVGDDRILVQMPGVENPAQLRTLLGSTAKMSFQMVAPGPGPSATLLPLRDGSGDIPVYDDVALSGDRLDAAASGFEPDTGQPMVTFNFDRQGVAAFAEITAANIGQRFAVVLDGEVLTAPVIQQAIPGGQGQITGDFTLEEAQTLAVLLTSGALPASLEVIEERSVGAALGADSIRAGLVTGAVGLALVVAIMVGLYGAWGLLASAILGLNVMLTLTALGLLGATLTLPGIAGIILCFGIAVDSNILIFSRIREETAKGSIAIKALTLGYGRAWATILDANITTLLAMVLLFMFGAGAIRGFAVTMSFGIVISMFTAVALMRFMMETLVRRRKLKRLDIAPLFGGVPAPGKLPFMRRGRLALVISAVLSVGSLGLLVMPGPNLGIDFTGGVQMVLRSDAPVPLSELRAAIAQQVPGDASLQAFGDPNEVLIRVQGEVGQATVAAVERAAADVILDAVFNQIDLVGPTISGELATTGLLALGLAVLAMLAYIWVRFEWYFAAGAIAVLFLDVTKTFGVIALMGWEVNLTTIVALLTLIGYSVNDKVVVYDRIREHLAGGSEEPLADVIDRSLNQVLARCIFTSGTTLAAIVPMAIWGGPAVSGFAWPMIAGVTIATASSLFVAGPVLAWLAQRKKVAAMQDALSNQA
ncbi:protein translocase subunit SecD [Sulfitobacter sp. M220]|jgi:SecD/SecF fusion protein|uniref:protein translocase subunit SecD n=1 Tax=Sulfitobacter TaxID=60136 RepID=UPI000C5663DC|nr:MULTISPECIES: protein translocase subunit SecD [unclassified Sulfitobacter]MBA98844.1 protein translocase subunit SecDF [Roseobacter sp.]MBV48497.1 protein translocase subunit SecDF [Roseobacter sp.]MCF7726628.1 protein translocase subunit SecD [Sulfitobacter sp. M22]MCF7777970.1 protein translocase subunit SecD [Sulfitobacter sp. M220]